MQRNRRQEEEVPHPVVIELLERAKLAIRQIQHRRGIVVSGGDWRDCRGERRYIGPVCSAFRRVGCQQGVQSEVIRADPEYGECICAWDIQLWWDMSCPIRKYVVLHEPGDLAARHGGNIEAWREVVAAYCASDRIVFIGQVAVELHN